VTFTNILTIYHRKKKSIWNVSLKNERQQSSGNVFLFQTLSPAYQSIYKACLFPGENVIDYVVSSYLHDIVSCPKTTFLGKAWWYSIIPNTQDVKIRRIVIGRKPKQKIMLVKSHLNKKTRHGAMCLSSQLPGRHR
jgi:hypothetical protein